MWRNKSYILAAWSWFWTILSKFLCHQPREGVGEECNSDSSFYRQSELHRRSLISVVARLRLLSGLKKTFPVSKNDSWPQKSHLDWYSSGFCFYGIFFTSFWAANSSDSVKWLHLKIALMKMLQSTQVDVENVENLHFTYFHSFFFKYLNIVLFPKITLIMLIVLNILFFSRV